MSRESEFQETLQRCRRLGLALAPYEQFKLISEINPQGALGYLAMVTGSLRPIDPESNLVPSFNYEFHVAKSICLAEGYAWAEIAEAMGEGQGRTATARVRSRYMDNQRRLEETRKANS